MSIKLGILAVACVPSRKELTKEVSSVVRDLGIADEGFLVSTSQEWVALTMLGHDWAKVDQIASTLSSRFRAVSLSIVVSEGAWSWAVHNSRGEVAASFKPWSVEGGGPKLSGSVVAAAKLLGVEAETLTAYTYSSEAELETERPAIEGDEFPLVDEWSHNCFLKRVAQTSPAEDDDTQWRLETRTRGKSRVREIGDRFASGTGLVVVGRTLVYSTCGHLAGAPKVYPGLETRLARIGKITTETGADGTVISRAHFDDDGASARASGLVDWPNWRPVIRADEADVLLDYLAAYPTDVEIPTPRHRWKRYAEPWAGAALVWMADVVREIGAVKKKGARVAASELATFYSQYRPRLMQELAVAKGVSLAEMDAMVSCYAPE